MTDLSVIRTHGATQALTKPHLVVHSHPTPCEIRIAIWSAIARDHDNDETPRIPSHVVRLVEEAISGACDDKIGGAA